MPDSSVSTESPPEKTTGPARSDATQSLQELKAAAKALTVHAARLLALGGRSLNVAFTRLSAAGAQGVSRSMQRLRQWRPGFNQVSLAGIKAQLPAGRAFFPVIRRRPRWLVVLAATTAAALALILYLLATLPINGGLHRQPRRDDIRGRQR